MIKILSLSGNKGAGKDEICKMLQRDFKNVVRLAFADELKKEVSDIFRIELSELHKDEEYKNNTYTYHSWYALHSKYGVKKPTNNAGNNLTIRELLQIYGTEICRAKDEDYWIDIMDDKIIDIDADTYLTGEDILIVLTDTRFRNELKMGDKCKYYTSIWLNRKSTGSTDSHISEQDLSNECEYQVDARGLAQFTYTYAEVVDIIDCELDIQRIRI